MARYPIALTSDNEERSARSGKGPYMQNVIVEPKTPGEEVIRIVKRPGLDYITTADSGTYKSFGLYYSNATLLYQETLFLKHNAAGSATDWFLYRLNGTGSATQLYEFPGTAVASDVLAVFQKLGNNASGFDDIAIGFAGRGYIYSTRNSIAQITDADFPGSLRGFAYLDGYLCAAGAGGVFNSNINAWTTWQATNYILPQSMNESNGIQWIANHKNHIAVFGKNSIEFLYNAGNPTASPFSVRQENQIFNVGLFQSNTMGATPTNPRVYLVDIDRGERIAFVSHSAAGVLGVHVLDNFRLTKISSITIDKYLNQKFDETVIRHPMLATFSINGRTYLVLTIRSYDNSTERYKSWVYDLEGGVWTPWTADSTICPGGNFDVAAASALAYSSGATVQDKPLGSAVQMSDSKIYYLNEEGYQDENSSAVAKNITVEVVTPKYRGPERTNALAKFQRDLYVFADRYPDPGTIDVSFTDDDYQTYSTAVTLDLSDPDAHLAGLGSFTERAFKLSHTANAPLRLEQFMESGINI